MKKQFVFAILLCLSQFLYCQIDKLSIGGIGGPGLSLLYGNFNLKGDHKVAARGSAGIFAQYKFNKYLSISGDILFSQVGSNLLSGNIPGYNYIFAYHLNYLTIPALLKFGGGNKVYVYGLVGPYLGIFLNGMEHSDYPGTLQTNNIPVYYKRFDGGITMGIGLSYPFSKKLSFVCEVRNNLGLVNIASEQNSGLIDGDAKNFIGILMLGISYKLGKQSDRKKS